MYADREDATARRSIKERLNGDVVDDSVRRRPVTGKRQREDDKWEHDLFEDDGPRLSSNKLDARDLRLKLQKNTQHLSQNRGARDLREKLSGSMHSQPMNLDPPKPKLKSEPEVNKTTIKSVTEVRTVNPTKVTNPTSRNKTLRKADTSVDGFLQSLGLEKYLITFQAEEVDMTALEHMTDEDLKAIGIPMPVQALIRLAAMPLYF